MRKFMLFTILVLCSFQAFSITLDELINSYDFSYEDENFELNNLVYNDSLNLTIDFENSFGDFLFVLDFYNENLFKFRIYNQSYFANGNNQIFFSIPLKDNFTNYKLNLQIYKDDLIVYRNDFEIEIFNITISNNSISNIIYNDDFNISINNNNLIYLNYEEIKSNHLIKKLVFNFQTNLEGNYLSYFYFDNKIFKNEIEIKDNFFSIEIDAKELYKLQKNGFYEIKKLILYKNNEVIESVLINEFTNKYFFTDFVKPNLSDLMFNFENDSNSSLINLFIVNNGSINAYGVYYKILNENLTILKEERIDILQKNQSFYVGSFNLTNFYGFIDLNDEILEINENNNLFIWPIPIEEKNLIVSNNNSNYINENKKYISSSSSGSSSNPNANSQNIKTTNLDNNSNFFQLNISENIIKSQSNSKNNSLKSFNDNKINNNDNNLSLLNSTNNNLERTDFLIEEQENSFNLGIVSVIGSLFVGVFTLMFLIL